MYLLYPYVEDIILIKDIEIDIYQMCDAKINLSDYFVDRFANLANLNYDLLPMSNINNTYNLYYNNKIYKYEIIDITNNINKLKPKSYLENVINDEGTIIKLNDYNYPSYSYFNNNLIIDTKSLIRYFAGSISQKYII